MKVNLREIISLRGKRDVIQNIKTLIVWPHKTLKSSDLVKQNKLLYFLI